MQTLRLYDPGRRPANWTDIIRPHQFAAFAKQTATGIACNLQGQPFDADEHAECVLFDSFREARRASEAAVLATPGIQIDIFDAQGRANPPLLTIHHPGRVLGDASPRSMLWRRVIGWAFIVVAAPLLVLAYRLNARQAILPALLGLNLLLAGGRLLWFNFAVREAERTREDRVARLGSNGQDG